MRNEGVHIIFSARLAPSLLHWISRRHWGARAEWVLSSAPGRPSTAVLFLVRRGLLVFLLFSRLPWKNDSRQKKRLHASGCSQQKSARGAIARSDTARLSHPRVEMRASDWPSNAKTTRWLADHHRQRGWGNTLPAKGCRETTTFGKSPDVEITRDKAAAPLFCRADWQRGHLHAAKLLQGGQGFLSLVTRSPTSRWPVPVARMLHVPAEAHCKPVNARISREVSFFRAPSPHATERSRSPRSGCSCFVSFS